MRVVIAEDHALLREGVVALLREHDIEVVAQAEDGAGLAADRRRPQARPGDRRRPPAADVHRRGPARGDRGARARCPGLGVLILSQYVEPAYTAELLASGEGGVGYLLKERVGEVARRSSTPCSSVAAGGTALDREVVAELVRAAATGPRRRRARRRSRRASARCSG